jgi:thiosulfate dehydrogenase
MNCRRSLRLSTALAVLVAAAFTSVLAAETAPVPADAPERPQRPNFPAPTDYPAGEFGKMVRLGENIFVNTPEYAKSSVGNGLTCANCHLDRGRLGDSSPMWAVFGIYPQYRKKSEKVDTLEYRLQDCFRFSMNGTRPPADSPELVAVESYVYWLSTGAPIGTALPGRGYPALPKPPSAPSIERGAGVFAANCALCHGEDGHGRKVGARYVFPPVSGPDSYNWGAGMSRVPVAAAFVKANMPFGSGTRLTDQQAWDVAAFVDSRPRPQDPRFAGSVDETRQKYHSADDFYGQTVDGIVVGSPESIDRAAAASPSAR